MHHPFIPATLLLFLPALLLAWRLRRLDHGMVRITLAILAAAIVGISVLHGGVDFDHLKRIKMLLAAATALVLGAQSLGFLGAARLRRWILAALAATSWLVHFNFLSFHGTGDVREFVHLHDVAHYYLGSKYFEEIAHADLYVAMVRAEADRFGIDSVSGEIRNLRDNSLIPARSALRDSDVVKAAFTPTRWQAFQDDVAFFRTAMGRQYRKILIDFGYNPTPLWTAFGGTLATMVPAGSRIGIRMLTAIDPLLEIATFAAIGWAFGIEIMLVAMIYFCLLFGASFGWLGGAMLRHLWFAALVVSACSLHKQRYTAAGALLALAAALRVFPIFFAIGTLARLASHGANRRLSPQLLRYAAGLVGGGLALLAITASVPRGLESWWYFQANMARHVQNVAFNTIGLTHLVHPPVDWLSSGWANIDKTSIHALQLFTVAPLAVLWTLRRARQVGELEAMVIGFIALFVALDLACYYYVALVLLVFALRDRPGALAMLFAADAISYTTLLFENRDEIIFLYRNWVVAMMLGAFLLPATDTRRRD